jgi:DNA-binding PadR family transcriptional regulator
MHLTMQISDVYTWIVEREDRRAVLLSLRQPMTAKQVGKKTRFSPDTGSHLLRRMAAQGLVVCVNPEARCSRLYRLTELGQACRDRVRKDLALPRDTKPEPDVDSVDWKLYGWICFNHRAIVIRTMTRPMQPSEIKRIVRARKPHVKISANNIRDVMKLLLVRGIVKPVKVSRKAHLRYELTDLGRQLQKLLIRAEMDS